MAIYEREAMYVQRGEHDATNGAALAAFLAAGIGSFAMGLIVVLDQAGAYTPPTLYEPAGGVSGRTTLAVVVWLVSWVLLHFRWRNRQRDARWVFPLTLFLIALGVLGTYPPFWGVWS